MGSCDGDQLLVFGGVGRNRRPLRNHDHVLDRLGVGEALKDGQQCFVDDDRLVGRIADDEGELVLVQARIDRVDHGAHRGRGEVELEVLGLVPSRVATRSPGWIPRACSADAARRARSMTSP